MENYSKAYKRAVRRHIYRRGKRGKLSFEWTLDNGVRLRRALNEIDMDKGLEKALKVIEQHEAVNPTRMTVTQLRDEFLNKQEFSAGYRDLIKLTVRYFLERFGDLRIAAVSRKHAQTFKEYLQKRTCGIDRKTGETRYLSGCAVNGHMRVLRSMFGYASFRKEYIVKNPFARFERARVPRRAVHTYTPEEARQILARTEEMFGRDFAMMIELFLHTGMRRGEWTAIHWDMIDFDRRIIDIPAKLTKTNEERLIPLDSRSIEILHELKTRHPKPVPYDAHTVTRYFAKVRDALGLRGRLHDTRKTINTLLKRYVNDSFAEKLLGHSSTQVNNNIYTSFDIETIRGGLEEVNRLLRGEPQSGSKQAGSQAGPPNLSESDIDTLIELLQRIRNRGQNGSVQPG